MPTKKEVVAEQVTEIRQDLRDLWTALRTDPKVQKRKERMWAILLGVLAGAATAGARQGATKIWTRVTGEPPPTVQKAREEAVKFEKEASS